MKEENSVLKDLLNEYKLIYGEKTLEGREIEIPFEYLVKENKTMYKMLLTLLPQLEYHKKDLTDFRETLESVETIVKEFKGWSSEAKNLVKTFSARKIIKKK